MGDGDPLGEAEDAGAVVDLVGVMVWVEVLGRDAVEAGGTLADEAGFEEDPHVLGGGGDVEAGAFGEFLVHEVTAVEEFPKEAEARWGAEGEDEFLKGNGGCDGRGRGFHGGGFFGVFRSERSDLSRNQRFYKGNTGFRQYHSRQGMSRV